MEPALAAPSLWRRHAVAKPASVRPKRFELFDAAPLMRENLRLLCLQVYMATVRLESDATHRVTGVPVVETISSGL